MKIKLNLAEAYLVKQAMEGYVEAENEREEIKLIAKGILLKLNK